MECISVIEKKGEYKILDNSKFCPQCKTKTEEMKEESSISKKCFCNKCEQAFIKEVFIDCINKKIEVRLKKI